MVMEEHWKRGMTVNCNLCGIFGDISRWIPRQMVASQAKDFLATPRDLLPALWHSCPLHLPLKSTDLKMRKTERVHEKEIFRQFVKEAKMSQRSSKFCSAEDVNLMPPALFVVICESLFQIADDNRRKRVALKPRRGFHDIWSLADGRQGRAIFSQQFRFTSPPLLPLSQDDRPVQLTTTGLHFVWKFAQCLAVL